MRCSTRRGTSSNPRRNCRFIALKLLFWLVNLEASLDPVGDWSQDVPRDEWRVQVDGNDCVGTLGEARGRGESWDLMGIFEYQ